MGDALVESVAVGFFDGVHIGHQAILRGVTTAVTFRNHPLSVLSPERAPRLIMSLEDRLAAIRACGVREVFALDFTEAFAHESPEDFAGRLVRQTHPTSCVRCGEDWRFGAQGAGDAGLLRKCGVKVEVVPYAEYKGERVSSTRIRSALEAGRMTDANAMMGRPFQVSGATFRGKGEGRALGFPTVNFSLELSVRIPFGVYAVEVCGRRGVANYGVAPTMGPRAWNVPCLEVHFLDGQAVDVQGQRLRIAFLDFLRSERRFETTDALARQIAADVAAAGALK